MKINIERCLEFFDERRIENKGHSNSIIAMLGEDLAASAFKSYRKSMIECKERKFQAEGFQKGTGPQLDRWLYDKRKKVLYQCEIKNWCAWAIAGQELKVNAKINEVQRISSFYWLRPIKMEFLKKGKSDKTSKVLVEMKMKPPNRKYLHAEIKPLLILWWPVSTEKNLNPYFSVNVSDLKIGFTTPFKQLHIFSISLYLRQLHKKGIKWLTIDNPDIRKRMILLKELLKDI